MQNCQKNMFKQSNCLIQPKTQKAIEYLLSEARLKQNQIVKFLHSAEKLNKRTLGDFLGEPDTEYLSDFVNSIDFSGLDLMTL